MRVSGVSRQTLETLYAKKSLIDRIDIDPDGDYTYGPDNGYTFGSRAGVYLEWFLIDDTDGPPKWVRNLYRDPQDDFYFNLGDGDIIFFNDDFKIEITGNDALINNAVGKISVNAFDILAISSDDEIQLSAPGINITGVVGIDGTLNATYLNVTELLAEEVTTTTLSVTDNTLVANLNADLLDGQEGTYYASRTGAETLTNKTIDGDSNTIQDLPITAIKTDVSRANKSFIFDASGVPSTEVNEKGTFTPKVADAISGGNVATGGTVNGYYIKKGTSVTVYIHIQNVDTSGMTGANNLFITDLPFVPETLANGGSGTSAMRLENIAYSGSSPVAQTQGGAAYIRPYSCTSGGAAVQVKVSDVTSGNNRMTFNINYRAAS